MITSTVEAELPDRSSVSSLCGFFPKAAVVSNKVAAAQVIFRMHRSVLLEFLIVSPGANVLLSIFTGQLHGLSTPVVLAIAGERTKKYCATAQLRVFRFSRMYTST